MPDDNEKPDASPLIQSTGSPSERSIILDALKSAKKECRDISSSHEGWCTGQTIEKLTKAISIMENSN